MLNIRALYGIFPVKVIGIKKGPKPLFYPPVRLTVVKVDLDIRRSLQYMFDQATN